MRYRILSMFLWLVLCASLCQGAGPKESVSDIFLGVQYLRYEQDEPVRQVSHVVKINLNTPGIRFTTTPGNGEAGPRETWCETTREFVQNAKAQIGINGNFFINDKETHAELLGLAVSDGKTVSPWDRGWAKFAVNIAEDNSVTFLERADKAWGTTKTHPEALLYNTLSGNMMIVKGGQSTAPEGGRTASQNGNRFVQERTLLLLIVDGRQPEYSVGMTYAEMASIFLKYGAVEALALTEAVHQPWLLRIRFPRLSMCRYQKCPADFRSTRRA